MTEAVIDETAREGHHPQSDAFLNEWEMRVRELIDRYQPDLIYFDNGINYRSLDPWKLRIARYYYNSAAQWSHEVSIQSKSTAYLAGSIQDFERMSRAPKQATDNYWQVDDPIGNKFGYIEGLKLQNADGIICSLVNNISKNGNLCLNVSPKANGTIPDDQQQVLRTVGRWLKTYGEGVYGTRAWTVSDELGVRFTCRGDSVVYAFAVRWDGKPFALSTLNTLSIDSVTCLADGRPVAFRHTDDGLLIDATMSGVTDPVVCFKIKVKHRRRVLFIGDSITDGGWGRSGGSIAPSDKRNLSDLNHLLGHGYVEMCAAHFQSTYPERDYEFLNRGISGNTLSDLQQRWQQDALSLRPDVVSILIGTNDADTFIRDTTQVTFDYGQWEQGYRQLLDSLCAQNQQVEIVLCTPFVARVGKIGLAENYSERKSIIQRLSDIVRAIAIDYQAILVPFDELFTSLQTPEVRPDYWIWDGIHPTTAGHSRMADLWIKYKER